MNKNICIGTMLWGSKTNEHQAHAIIEEALEYGVDFFDTAQIYPTFPYTEKTYGLSERILGDFIAKNPNKLRVSTKLKSPVEVRDVRTLVDESLQRLNVERIDYLHFHWPRRDHYHFRQMWNYKPTDTNMEYFDRCSEVLNDLVDEGKIDNICMSNETAWGVTQWAQRLPLKCIQNEYSLLHRIFELDVAEACHHHDVKLLAWTPLAGGLLTGKYTYIDAPEYSRRTYGGLGPRDNKNVWEPIRRYKEIAEDVGMTLTQMSMAWVLRQPLLEAMILGVTNVSQLKENLDHIPKLDDMTMQNIKLVFKDHPIPF
jgi:aryl-alcohol dehydrogenase-like predicted oxidoreductase